VALADPDAKRAGAMFKRYEKVPKYKDFRVMLDKERKNIDAVIVAIPDTCTRPPVCEPWNAASTSIARSPSPGLSGKPASHPGGRQVQGCHPDGQPGLLLRRQAHLGQCQDAQFTNNREANKYVRQAFRKGWEVRLRRRQPVLQRRTENSEVLGGFASWRETYPRRNFLRRW